jgi:hypothetical protein
VERIVSETLGTGNRDVERIQSLRVTRDGWVHITWAINDNLSVNLVAASAKLDITEVAEALCNAGYCDGLTMHGTFSMQDQYGNVTEDTVVHVVLRPETLEKINWENFVHTNIYNIADIADVHPQFDVD